MTMFLIGLWTGGLIGALTVGLFSAVRRAEAVAKGAQGPGGNELRRAVSASGTRA